VLLLAYSVEKLASSTNLFKFAQFGLTKLLILLGHVSAKAPQIQQGRVFQHNIPITGIVITLA